MKNRQTKILFILLISIGLWIHPSLWAEDSGQEIAYQLASIHTRSLQPEKILMNSSTDPDNATVSEFKWLFDSLKNRCINSDQQIVTTIISAWKLVRNRGYDMSLLETTRALTDCALNKRLFSNGKVDFEKTSGYWTSHYKPEKK